MPIRERARCGAFGVLGSGDGRGVCRVFLALREPSWPGVGRLMSGMTTSGIDFGREPVGGAGLPALGEGAVERAERRSVSRRSASSSKLIKSDCALVGEVRGLATALRDFAIVASGSPLMGAATDRAVHTCQRR